jgi:hypothetical protein
MAKANIQKCGEQGDDLKTPFCTLRKDDECTTTRDIEGLACIIDPAKATDDSAKNVRCVRAPGLHVDDCGKINKTTYASDKRGEFVERCKTAVLGSDTAPGGCDANVKALDADLGCFAKNSAKLKLPADCTKRWFKQGGTVGDDTCNEAPADVQEGTPDFSCFRNGPTASATACEKTEFTGCDKVGENDGSAAAKAVSAVIGSDAGEFAKACTGFKQDPGVSACVVTTKYYADGKSRCSKDDKAPAECAARSTTTETYCTNGAGTASDGSAATCVALQTKTAAGAAKACVAQKDAASKLTFDTCVLGRAGLAAVGGDTADKTKPEYAAACQALNGGGKCDVQALTGLCVADADKSDVKAKAAVGGCGDILPAQCDAPNGVHIAASSGAEFTDTIHQGSVCYSADGIAACAPLKIGFLNVAAAGQKSCLPIATKDARKAIKTACATFDDIDEAGNGGMCILAQLEGKAGSGGICKKTVDGAKNFCVPETDVNIDGVLRKVCNEAPGAASGPIRIGDEKVDGFENASCTSGTPKVVGRDKKTGADRGKELKSAALVEFCSIQ